MLTVSERGFSLIKEFEGFSPIPYICPAGKKTIGYGHVIRDGEVFFDEITQENANIILKQDVKIVESTISRLVCVEITQNQVDALASFIYNIGVKAFEKSTLLRFLNKKEYKKAAEQFSRWIFGGGKRLAGLEKRREAEKTLFIREMFTKL